MSETEIVTGTVDSILIKGKDKWQAIVKTPESGTYGKKLWTKDEDVFHAVTSLIGQQATFECGVSHYEIEGKPTSSLWINSVNPGTPPPQEPPGAVEAVQAVAQEATAATQTPAQPATQSPSPRESFGDPRQASIERQVALKCAVEYHVGGGGSPENVIATAEKFDAFLARVTPF